MSIHLGSYARRLPIEHDAFLAQYGVGDVTASYVFLPQFQDPLFWGDPNAELGFDELGTHWELLDLVKLRNRFASSGLKLIGMQMALPRRCLDRIVLGEVGRDEQIEQIILTIRNMGRAGLTVFGYAWSVNAPGQIDTSWRTSQTSPGRGGARVTSFDSSQIPAAYYSRGRRIMREDLFKHYEYFLERVLPAAEEAGVRLAIHPDDPPVASLGGADRLFFDHQSYREALALSSSRFHGVTLCFGNFGVMVEDPLVAIDQLGTADRIVLCHLQGTIGKIPTYSECFLDESDRDWLEILRALHKVGFDGAVFPAHHPETVFDTGPHRNNAIAYTSGYVKAMLQVVEGRRGADSLRLH
jgi:mannonate dehydratase